MVSLTKPFPQYLTPPLKSVQCLGVVVVAEEGVEVAAIVVEIVEEADKIKIKTIKRLLQVRSIRVLNIRICQLVTGKGALCTSAGAGELSSVVNRRPVLGRMSTLPSLPNETGTSSDLILKQVTI